VGENKSWDGEGMIKTVILNLLRSHKDEMHEKFALIMLLSHLSRNPLNLL